ncbi:uncharacterized protein LOC135849868 [Planococcus citri]|uniref:uncharacterized protein LOC135849868 n=1 Tax=Planococcus citri TaxID=170843 RepID=UPI0031F76244
MACQKHGAKMWCQIISIGFLIGAAVSQSNYDNQANSIEYTGDGLPESTILDGKITKLDDIAPIIFLNRTKAALNCAAGYMQIDLKFEHPFYGIVYADFDRSSSCIISGNGTRTARIDLPLKGCGTIQNPTRVFTNNIVVRFHSSLEMDGDEVITIVCRYPPPIAPPPPFPIPLQTYPETSTPAPLKGFQILLIICGILFLSLVLLGLAGSYYCLRNRRIQVIRRHPVPATGSEITKISDSSLGMYDGLKIPRAHTFMTTTASISESEVAIISGADTLPSDYPSESPSTTHSEVEEMDGRSLRRSLSSSGSYENKAYVQESSYFSEQYGHLSEMEINTGSAIKHRPPPPEPKFNVEMRIKKAPLPPPTPSPPSSDSEGSLIMQERNLSTIHERDETVELTERSRTFMYKPEIHTPPKAKSPPIYSEVIRKHDKVDKSEYIEETFDRSAMEESDFHRTELHTEVKEPPLVVQRRPEITSHFVDDVFLRTITEKKTIEDIERHRRQVTEYHAKPPPPPPTKWDVEIRNYPNPNAPSPSGDETATDWESHSENSSIYGIPAVSRSDERYRTQMDLEQQYRSTLDIPVPNPPPQNWDSLIKVLEYSPAETSETKEYRTEQTLSLEDKKKWRKIITTESTLRTMLTEASSREDYERIRKDQRYEKLFEPPKWDVIIRVLTPPDRLFDQRAPGGSNRYRRKSEWDTRSRRSSLPTLYEYDSDASSIRLAEVFAHPYTSDPLARSRRTSRSSLRSDMDVRSMSEIMVDFARQDVPDNMSDGSSYYRPRRYFDEDDEETGSLVRSLSQPSLARSASEFTESWGIRRGNWDIDSPEHSPRSSARFGRNEQSSSSTAYNVQQSSYSQQKRWFREGDN